MIANSATLIETPKTVDLLAAKEEFDRANAAFRQAVLHSAEAIWLPEDFGLAGGETPQAAIAGTWSDVYKPPKDTAPVVRPEAGLLCGSPELLRLAEELNLAKEALKSIIVAMRAALKKADEMREQLRTVGMLQYDLNKTYRRVLVLPHPIQSISWTWTIGHRKIEPVKVKDLRRGADDQSEKMQKTIFAALQSYADTTELARVKTRDIQLRANIHQLVSGEWELKPIVTSGPALLRQGALPGSIIWRPRPRQDASGNYLKPNRKRRSDQVLSAEPACVIGGVKYFEYLKQPKTVKRKSRTAPVARS